MARCLSDAVVAKICLAITLGVFLYYFMWVSAVVPFLLIDEGKQNIISSARHA